jgi:hypothetical protein
MEFESHFLGLLIRVDEHRETASGNSFLEGETPLIDLKQASD